MRKIVLSFVLLFYSQFLFCQVKTATFVWKQSLPVTWSSPEIMPIGGTEIRALVAFNKVLFASNGYWMDTSQKDAALPGPQVLRLDSANGKWQIDLELTQRNAAGLRLYQAISILEKISISRDGEGKKLKKDIDYLFAAVWKRGLGLDFFWRTNLSSKWIKTTIPGQEAAPRGSQIRAFAVHHDQITGADVVFAGARNEIYSGTFNQQLQKIVWLAQPEWIGEVAGNETGGKGRVASFVNCNGKLYAAVFDAVYERVDGKNPSWKKIFSAKINAESDKVTGFRGLTSVKNANGKGESIMIGVEDYPSRIYRVNPTISTADGSYESLLELDVSAFLTQQLGTKATYGIVGYNNMTPYQNGNCTELLIGLGSNTPAGKDTFVGKHVANGYFLIRSCDGKYSMQEIQDKSIAPKPKLVAVRTLVVSPFEKDLPGTIYAGGFDSNNYPVHNTGWLYKGVKQ